MLGAIVGTVCVLGLFKVARRVMRRRLGFGWRDGCGSHLDGGDDFGFRRRGRVMRWIFERLETTPGQERAIADAVARARQDQTAVREELRQTRADLARLLEGGLVDEAAVEETFARHDRLLARLRVGWVDVLKTVSETLDPEQRKKVAAMLQRGGWFAGRSVWV